MHTVHLRTVGDSVMFAIPRQLVDAVGLTPSSRVAVSVEDGRLVVSPQTRPYYRLEDLVAACDPEAPVSEETRAWLADAPVGREAL
jgi:antitoxin ChpS